MTIHPPAEQAFAVGAQRQEVMFRDGTHLVLHPVFDNGVPCLFLRAVDLQPAGRDPLIVDLRDLSPQLGADLLVTATRDVPGVVFFTLRHKYSTAELALRVALKHGRPLRERLAA